MAAVETIEEKRISDRKARSPRKAANRAARAALQNEEKVGLANSVCTSHEPQATDGSIPAEALTKNHIVVLKDVQMIVARKDSQLGVNISTKINETYCSDNVVIDRVNGVYPMSAETARTLVNRNTRSRHKIKGVAPNTYYKLKGVPSIALNTTYFTLPSR